MQTILITGASSGIGKAIALLFQKNGWRVAATMRNPEKETDLRDLERLVLLPLDVTKLNSITEAIEKTQELYGPIDVVVNNAGFATVGPFETATPEGIKKQFDTNVFGLMNVSQAILPFFRKRHSGMIVNISSMGGRLTFPLYSLYHATKWAVEGFTESLSYELRPLGIKVKLIEPGLIDTKFYKSAVVIHDDSLPDYDALVHKVVPTVATSGQFRSSPEAVARVVYKAATDKSWKLRYAASGNAPLLLFLRKIIPEELFLLIVRKIMVG